MLGHRGSVSDTVTDTIHSVSDTVTDTIHCVVLAAGLSQRFGESKMLAPVEGEALVRRVLRTVRDARVGPVHLIVGHDGKRVAGAAGDLCDAIVENPCFAKGMGTSIAAGVTSLPQDCEAVLIVLGDQPLVRTDHLRHLAETWLNSPGGIVASGYADTAGPPIVFPHTAFGELRALDSDRGAKALLDDGRFPVTVITAGDQALDVDTPADLDALQDS